MTADIANIILGYISTLPFFDKYTGLVRKVIRMEQGQDGRSIRKEFPVGCDVTYEDCTKRGKLHDLVPNSKYKSIHYFEEIEGPRLVEAAGGYYTYECTLRLVGWLNMKAVGKQEECSISSLAVTNILERLPSTTFNSGIYTKMAIAFSRQLVKDSRIFSPYTYDEAVTQYLMHPFDFYAVDFRVKFSLHKSCIEPFELEPIVC